MDTRKRGRLKLGFNSNGGLKKSKQGLILRIFGFMGFDVFLVEWSLPLVLLQALVPMPLPRLA